MMSDTELNCLLTVFRCLKLFVDDISSEDQTDAEKESLDFIDEFKDMVKKEL